MVSHRWPPRSFTDSRETDGWIDYEDGESYSARPAGLRSAESATVCGIQRSCRAACQRAELAKVCLGDRGSRGWVRDTFDRWDSMVDEYEIGATSGPSQPDQSASGPAGEASGIDGPTRGRDRAGTVAPQTLNTTRDVYYPQQDARGGGNIAGGAAIHEGNTKLLPWLMLTAVLAGIAAGISVIVVVNVSQSESRTRAELDKQNRFNQELRIRVEDAEIAAEEVNPKFQD